MRLSIVSSDGVFDEGGRKECSPYIVNSVMAYLTVKFILWKARSFAADSADILAVFKYVVEDAVQGF